MVSGKKLHNLKKSFWSICMKFSGVMCLDRKNICGNNHCKNKYKKVYSVVIFTGGQVAK